MRSKHLFLVFSLLMVAVLALSACAPPATPAPPAEAPAAPAEQPAEAPAAPAEPVTVTWAFWGSPEEAASHKIVADAFMAEHPEITIELWNQPWDDYFTKIQALWASGDAETIPDVAFLWPTPKYAAEGVLENLDSYITESGYSLDDYWPGLLESAKYEGSVYGFPRDIEVDCPLLQQGPVRQGRRRLSDENWTWDDLTAAAEKLTVKDASGTTTQYALAMEGGLTKWSKWVLQNGGSILDDMSNPSKCMVDEPAAIEAITFFADLMNNGYAMRPADLNQAGGDAARVPERPGGDDHPEHQPRVGLQQGGQELRRGRGADPCGRQAIQPRGWRGLGHEQRQRQQGCGLDLPELAAEHERWREDLHRARRDLPGAAVGGKLTGFHD